MAQNAGPIDFTSGTGVKSFNIGMTATWMEIRFKGSTIRPSEGFIYGGNQTCYPDDVSALNTSKAIQVKDTSGTVVFEGTWTSFSGNNVNFNVTTNTLGTPRALVVFGN